MIVLSMEEKSQKNVNGCSMCAGQGKLSPGYIPN